MTAILPNHSVEANRRPAAPPEAGHQLGSPFSARPYFPAAVAHLWRSTMEQEATRSNVHSQGVRGDSEAPSTSSGKGRPNGMVRR